MALQGHNVEVLDAVDGITMTAEATSTSDSITYQITNASKRLIDLNTDLVVKDGVSETSENYKVNYLDGSITFDDTASRTITIDGAYLVPSVIATANSYSFSGTCDALENTPFNSSNKTFVAGLISGTINLGRFHESDSLFVDALLDGKIKIIKILLDSSDAILAYGVMTSNSIDSTPSTLVNESISYQISNDIGVI